MTKNDIRAISSLKYGNLWFTVKRVGKGKFKIDITKIGRQLLLSSLESNVQDDLDDDIILKYLYEQIEMPMKAAESKVIYYPKSLEIDTDIPF